MKSILYTLLSLLFFLTHIQQANADVSISSSAIPAASANQGSTAQPVYIAQVAVTTTAVTVNNIQVTLLGSHDANDLTIVRIYFNATAPTIAGAANLSNVVGTFAAPHTYNIAISQAIAAGAGGYFIVAVDVNATGTDNNTVQVNGATNPVALGFTTSPTVINNQTNAAGVLTIQAADITLASSVVSAANVNQGTTAQPVYVVQMAVATNPVLVNSIQVNLTGTHDANDLTIVRVYFNATSPTIAGASNLSNVVATFAAPHLYNINISQSIAAGGSGYFIIAVDVNATATDNNTVHIDGAINPVSFGFSTAPNINNNQTNAAGVLTIQAADITLTTSAVSAANVNQGTTAQPVYVVQMAVATNPVLVNSIQVNLTGTHDANDLTIVRVYFNPTAPTIAGASNLSNVVATFAAPHLYNINISQSIAAGGSGYFIIAVDVNATATDNNTVHIDGATNPVGFGFSTAPNIANNQTNAAGVLTIQAADITLTTSVVPAASVNQGTTAQPVYIVQMAVATNPVLVNSIQANLTGTHDANDLTIVRVYFNPTAPTIAGASNLSNVVATFAAPHLYNINISQSIAAGGSGYFIIAVDVNATATDNNTVHIDGATNPVSFGFSTAPNINNNQTNAAGVLTIQAADITLTTSVVPAANVNQGTTAQPVYVVQMAVATNPVLVNSIQVNLTGTHDANDLTIVRIYFNATSPTIAGASNLSNVVATFAAPHLYNINISQSIAAGAGGYFIIAVDVNATATDNNTVHIDGAANPVSFGFSTAPNINNNQTNAAGVLTIQAADITLATSTVPPSNFSPGASAHLVYIVSMTVATQPVLVNNVQFTLTGTHDANDLTIARVYFNATSPTLAGASNLSNVVATFAAPHAYSVSISQSIAAGAGGYFIIAVDANATATIGNTVKINGATNPVTFGFTTAPNITNNQTDNGGLQVIPVSFINAIAQQEGNGVKILWKVGFESNMHKYIIERSANGSQFSDKGNVSATGNGNEISYDWFDPSPLPGLGFYRIKAVSLDGRIQSSAVLRINIDAHSSDLQIYPNPVARGKVLNLQWQNLSQGNYSIKIYNNAGQLLFRKNLQSSSNNRVETLTIDRLVPGNYQLEVRSDHTQLRRTFVVSPE